MLLLLFFLAGGGGWSGVCVCGGGLSGPKNSITQRPDPSFIVQIRVYLAYLFHKKLKLPIINVKPIAIIRNHNINETMYGNLANENFKMSQMKRK